MSMISRKNYAKRRLDVAAKRLANSLADSRHDFWRLLRALRASSLLSPDAAPSNIVPNDADRVLLACARITQHSDRWRRIPEHWNAPEGNPVVQFRSFVSHLFDLYAVPSFMSRVWLREYDAPWELELYFHLATGRSIRRLDVPMRLCKKAASLFMQAPDDLVPIAAMRWAHVRSLGGCSQLARQLANRTVLAAPTKHEHFWESVIRFLVRYQPIPLEESIEIVQFIHDQKFRPAKEAWRPCEWKVGAGNEPLQPDFTLQGRSLRSLRRHRAHWKTQLAGIVELPRLQRRAGWEQSGISPLTIKRGDETWSIVELLSREELSVEGGIMRHCIATYTSSCKRQHSSIWSMRVRRGEKMKRVLTIQVIPSKKMIWEAVGKSNQSPHPRAREFLEMWAQQEGLRLRELL